MTAPPAVLTQPTAAAACPRPKACRAGRPTKQQDELALEAHQKDYLPASLQRGPPVTAAGRAVQQAGRVRDRGVNRLAAGPPSRSAKTRPPVTCQQAAVQGQGRRWGRCLSRPLPRQQRLLPLCRCQSPRQAWLHTAGRRLLPARGGPPGPTCNNQQPLLCLRCVCLACSTALQARWWSVGDGTSTAWRGAGRRSNRCCTT